MRRKAGAADTTDSSSDATTDDPVYEDSSGFLVRLVSRILFRNGTDVLSRLLHPRTLPSAAHPPPSSLLASPPLATQPSLLSGFTLHPSDKREGPTEEAEELAELAISAQEFDVLLGRVPGDMRRACLLERRREYGEALRRLEEQRRAAVERLARVDTGIMRLVEERREVDRRLEQLGSEHQVGEPVEEDEEEVVALDIGDAESSSDAWAAESDDLPGLRLERTLRGHYGAVTSLAGCATLGLLASASVDTHVRVWDGTSTTCLYTIAGHSDAVRAVQFYERFLLTASNDSRVRMWDLSLLDSVQPQSSDPWKQPQYFPPVDGEGEGWWEDVEQSTTPPVTPTICRGLAPLELCCEVAFVGHGDAVTCMQAEDGTLVTGSADATVREWDVGTGAVRQTIDFTWATRAARSTARVDGPSLRGTELGDGGYVGALQFYGHALATGSADGVLRLWDLRTAQTHRQMHGHASGITSLRFDDREVVTGAADGCAVVWDLRMGRERQRVGFGGPVTCVQMGAQPGECWVAASDPAVHRYWAGSMQKTEYAAGQANVTRVRVQGSQVVTGDAEGTVRVWSL